MVILTGASKWYSQNNSQFYMKCNRIDPMPNSTMLSHNGEIRQLEYFDIYTF